MAFTHTVGAMRRFARFLPVFIAFFASSGCARPLTRDDITAASLRAHLTFLASDSLEGRKTGTRGTAAAEEYIAAVFRDAGLDPPPGRTGYFLDFPIYEYGFDRHAARLSVLTGKGLHDGIYGSDYVPLPFSADGLAFGEIVFAGYGISAPDAGYDDYAGLDVRGKIVLAFRSEPSRFHVKATSGTYDFSPRAHFTAKMKTAVSRGARAVLFVAGPGFPPDDEDLPETPTRMSLSSERPSNRIFRDGGAPRFAIPAFVLSVPFGNRLFAAAGLIPGPIIEGLDRGRKAKEFSLKRAIGLAVCRRYSPPRTLPSRNVAGFAAGSDPVLGDEWIVVAAHHDHIGTSPGTGDRIYNGADDNASGTSGVLELARVFAARSPRLKRSLLFITFSGEEEGLLGSEAVFDRDLIAPHRLKYMCNLDMIGRNPGQTLQVIVRQDDDPLINAARTFAAAQPLPTGIVFKPEDVYSDDYVFARNRIPTFFFFSGLHDDYHGLDDESDRIDYPALEKRVRFMYDFILFLDGQ